MFVLNANLIVIGIVLILVPAASSTGIERPVNPKVLDIIQRFLFELFDTWIFKTKLSQFLHSKCNVTDWEMCQGATLLHEQLQFFISLYICFHA